MMVGGHKGQPRWKKRGSVRQRQQLLHRRRQDRLQNRQQQPQIDHKNRQQCDCPVCTAAAVSPSMAAATSPPPQSQAAVMQPPPQPQPGYTGHVAGYQPVLGSVPPPPTPSPIAPTEMPSYASIDMFASPDF